MVNQKSETTIIRCVIFPEITDLDEWERYESEWGESTQLHGIIEVDEEAAENESFAEDDGGFGEEDGKLQYDTTWFPVTICKRERPRSS